jgi:acyl-CoA thioesterase
MLFLQTLASMRPQDNGFCAEIGEGWSQGRATFGGMVAALGNEAMRRLVPSDRALRGLEVTFIGPLLTGSVRIETEILRIGKVVTIAAARLWSDDKIASSMTGVYGGARATSISISPPTPPRMKDVEQLPDADYPPHLGGPAFLQQFGLRFAEGSWPFSGLSLSRSKAYIRHKDPAALTESHVVALIDCIPSPVMQMMSIRAPSSSLIWTLQFLRHDYSFATDSWWRIDTDIDSAGDGYACQSSLVLDPNGVPAAISRQLVAVFG